MSALKWEEITTGQVKAVSREPIAIYEISEVPISKQQSQFRIQITTETGTFALPRGYRTMGAAQRACNGHLNNCRRDKWPTQMGDWAGLTRAQARELAHGPAWPWSTPGAKHSQRMNGSTPSFASAAVRKISLRRGASASRVCRSTRTTTTAALLRQGAELAKEAKGIMKRG